LVNRVGPTTGTRKLELRRPRHSPQRRGRSLSADLKMPCAGTGRGPSAGVFWRASVRRSPPTHSSGAATSCLVKTAHPLLAHRQAGATKNCPRGNEGPRGLKFFCVPVPAHTSRAPESECYPPDLAAGNMDRALRRSAASERPSLSSGFDWQWTDRLSTSPVATRRFVGSIRRSQSVASQTKDQALNGVDEAAGTTARSAQPEPMRIRRRWQCR